MTNRHLEAIRAGYVTRSNIIGMCKALNALARVRRGYSVSRTAPRAATDGTAQQYESAVMLHQPHVTGELLLTGMALLESPRWRNRFIPHEREIIADIDTIRLARFDWPTDTHCVPVYRVIGCNGGDMLYRNIPWQTALAYGLESGPTVETE
jgi:hypothetical protein